MALILPAAALEPNDPLYQEGKLWYLTDINAPAAWWYICCPDRMFETVKYQFTDFIFGVDANGYYLETQLQKKEILSN